MPNRNLDVSNLPDNMTRTEYAEQPPLAGYAGTEVIDSSSNRYVSMQIVDTNDYQLNAIAFIQHALEGNSGQDAHRILDYVKTGIDGRRDESVPY